MKFIKFRCQCMLALAAGLVVVAVLLYPTGYFGPLSSRIRGLFVKHTKTGNPLVDSVAEHQPAQQSTYDSFLNLPLDFAYHAGVVGLLYRTNGVYFLYLYAFIATHFSGKMSRLVLICAPITSIGCALFWGWILDFIIEPFLLFLGKKGFDHKGPSEAIDAHANGDATNGKADSKKQDAAKTPPQKSLPLAAWEEDRPGGICHMKLFVKNGLYRLIPSKVEM